ncbi:Proheparin-binding EGF-like growth factor [Varanus komodoensis]|nr:Proheparin-binding EGF-like growth factor [Varanus komodoensis]
MENVAGWAESGMLLKGKESARVPKGNSALWVRFCHSSAEDQEKVAWDFLVSLRVAKTKDDSEAEDNQPWIRVQPPRGRFSYSCHVNRGEGPVWSLTGKVTPHTLLLNRKLFCGRFEAGEPWAPVHGAGLPLGGTILKESACYPDFAFPEIAKSGSGRPSRRLPVAFLSRPQDPVTPKNEGKRKKRRKGKGRKRDPCLRKYKDFCIHGECMYIKELKRPACRQVIMIRPMFLQSVRLLACGLVCFSLAPGAGNPAQKQVKSKRVPSPCQVLGRVPIPVLVI